MLEIRDLVVRYGAAPALRGISLEVRAGEVVALIGPNGAGKSTTLASIAGLVRPAVGSIIFEGHSLGGRPPEAIVRRGISLVPEGRHIFQSLTVGENLWLGATHRRDRHQVEQDVQHLLDAFPILRASSRLPAGRLSGGEQQQLAIARGLLARPRLLLLDEPSLGLAPRVIDLLFDSLARLRDQGVTLLLVEQSAARAVAFADRTYVLRSGEIALSGRREDLLGRTDLVEAYLGDGRASGAALANGS